MLSLSPEERAAVEDGLPDLVRSIWAAVEENFGYRRLNAFWRLGGLVEALRGTRHDWGEMTRQGFGTDP